MGARGGEGGGGSLGSRDPPQVEPRTGNLRQKVHRGKQQIVKDRYTLIEQSQTIVCLRSPEPSFIVNNSCYKGQLLKHLVVL